MRERRYYERYTALKDSKGVTDYAVARATGISPVVFSEWKKGKANPKVDKLMLIAKFFEVPLEELIGEP